MMMTLIKSVIVDKEKRIGTFWCRSYMQMETRQVVFLTASRT